MIRRKKQVKRFFLASFFIITVFLSNVYILNYFNISQTDQNETSSEETKSCEINLNSNLNLSDSITGSGIDQDVRIYVNNKSQNLKDNQEYFEIPSLTSEEMVLTFGNFSFSFQNNYTTDYIIEDDDALYADDFISFDFDSDYSNITIHNGSVGEGYFSDLIDGIIDDDSDYFELISDNKGVLNFTITANYTNTKYLIQDFGYVQFNATKILALISSLSLTLNISANMTMRIRNFSQPSWKELISALPINSSITQQELLYHIINQNLNFMNISSNITEIQFIFERWDQESFEAYLHEYRLQPTYAFDLPITNTSYVALEFDLKGKESSLNGLNVWIRTLNISKAADTHFNITLYRANGTILRVDENNLRTSKIVPDYNNLIDNIIVDNYIGDNYSYFEFDTSKTGKLNLSNYFIVIKSNSSDNVYSLVTLPYFDYGDIDKETEHQLKITNDDGNKWNIAKKLIKTNNEVYQSGQLDASLFTLNVTRGYMPSDFNMSGKYNLTIQNFPIEDLEISAYPYNESSYLKWGIGQWIHNFTTPISDEGTNNFTVYLSWNKSNIKGFKFNVSYSVNAYWIEKALATYSVNYNSDPEWILNYTRDNTNPKFNNWTFYEFWYIYPDFLNAQNLTNPIDQEILWRLKGQSDLSSDPSRYKLIVPMTIADKNGDYLLNLTSHNFIHKMHSYINYNGTLWETNGFMYGDNISIAVEIQDHNLKAPLSGNANGTLFYPNGTRFIGATLNSSDGFIDETILFYDFANHTILNFSNSLNIFGEYRVGFFWFNGTAIGCKDIIIYLDSYETELYDFEYYPSINKNIIDGKIEKVYQNFTLLLASVYETTGYYNPSYYPIDDPDINIQLIYEIADQEIPILIDTFKQSQNILNPNEIVNVKVTIQNLYEILSVNAKINVKLVSFANEDWIIAENTTSNVLLEFSGHPNDNYEFNMNLKIPDLNETTKVWAGKNNPIRLSGAKTLITVIIDDNNIGTCETEHYSLLSSEMSDTYDGRILSLKINEEMVTKNIINAFNRDECLYVPYETSFLVNIFDKNYVSSYEQCNKEFSLKLNSRFTNITISPEIPIKGQSFNISSILTTEFGVKLTNKNISYQYYSSNSWVNLGSDITDLNGFTRFTIDTQKIDIEGDLLIRISWDGDNTNGASKNLSINILYQSSEISVSINKNSALIYRNRKALITISIRNIGTANLRILKNISIDFNRSLSYSIVSIDYLKFEQFLTGETTNLIMQIEVGNINNLEISSSITTQNILTNESKTFTAKNTFTLNDPPIYDYFTEYFIVIMITILVTIWLLALMYAWKTKKRIETPIEEPIKKRPRRERYVPVSELKKPTPPKKDSKKKEELKEEEEKNTMDLDSLLEERGLMDKKKKKNE